MEILSWRIVLILDISMKKINNIGVHCYALIVLPLLYNIKICEC